MLSFGFVPTEKTVSHALYLESICLMEKAQYGCHNKQPASRKLVTHLGAGIAGLS
jgi:hypothetical protein